MLLNLIWQSKVGMKKHEIAQFVLCKEPQADVTSKSNIGAGPGQCVS